MEASSSLSHHPRLLISVICVAIIVEAFRYGASAASVESSTCSTSYTLNKQNKLFTKCEALKVQNAFMAWTYDKEQNTVEVLFDGVAPSAGGWVAWGVNPTGLSMEGTQAFAAFAAPNGSTILTYNVTLDNQDAVSHPLKCTPISLVVVGDKMEVEISGTSILMLVTLQLRPNQSTSLDIVWNRGSSVSNFVLGPHPTDANDLNGLKTINVATGAASPPLQPPHQMLKNKHGILNTVGWGILIPCGMMVARYLRFADPAWFYLHVFIQVAGYTLGVAGWATGLKLGNYSIGVMYKKHRFIGITLFAIATLQVTAILLRPKKDHKIRKVWKYYHFALGIIILVLGILNVFNGFDILSPPKMWEWAYKGVLIALGVLAICLEILRWLGALTKRRCTQNEIPGAKVGQGNNSDNGYIQV